MQLWATIIKDNRTTESYTLETDFTTRAEVENWDILIGDICHELDLARPVILKKHYNELMNFSHTVFTKADFMEPIKFDKFKIEILNEKKKKK